jgi:hypothetical protein
MDFDVPKYLNLKNYLRLEKKSDFGTAGLFCENIDDNYTDVVIADFKLH